MRRAADIQEVARRAKVSTATVSRVLNGFVGVRKNTSERVRRAVAELNYIPNTSARNLRVGRSKLFGLIVSDIKNPFFPELIDSFEEMAARHGIDLIFTHTNYDSERLAVCMQRLVERNVDGIAVMTSEVEEEALAKASRSRVPVVLLNQAAFADRYQNVVVEYSRGFREAVHHLQELGHSDIGFISGPPGFSSARRRGGAFRMAMRQCGLRLHKEWIAVGDLRVQGGYAAMGTLLAANPRPTAVVTTNDLMAVGALQAAQAAGVRVPEELSIVGFDDLPIAAMMHPPLTTIHLSRKDIAAQAFAALVHLSRKSEGEPFTPAKVRPQLVVRGSTGALHPAIGEPGIVMRTAERR